MGERGKGCVCEDARCDMVTKRMPACSFTLPSQQLPKLRKIWKKWASLCKVEQKMFVERPWQNSFSTLIFYSILERGVCSRGDCNVGLLAGALKNKLLNGENPIVLQAIGPRAQLRSLKAANAAGLMRNAANFRRLHGVVAWWSPTFNYRTFHAECIFFVPD